MLSRYFIERPILASVVSILIVFAGAISIFGLPIAQYPEIVPPVVQVTAYYPGADPQVIAETVAAPIEQQVNGVENMLYMSSQSAADGSYTLNVTFELGTNIDMNTVLTQNRVSAATGPVARGCPATRGDNEKGFQRPYHGFERVLSGQSV